MGVSLIIMPSEPIELSNSVQIEDCKEGGVEVQEESNKTLPRLLTENLNRNLCVCYDVPKQDIIDAFNAGAHTFDAISNQTYACQGSGCCQRQLERLIEVLTEHKLSAAPDTPDGPENEQA